MLRSAVRRVRSHRPHYATPDTCEAFATLFVLVCRRTPPVPPIKAACHKLDMQLCRSRKYSEVYATGFGMDLRTYCIVHIYKVKLMPDVKHPVSEKAPLLPDICISYGP